TLSSSMFLLFMARRPPGATFFPTRRSSDLRAGVHRPRGADRAALADGRRRDDGYSAVKTHSRPRVLGVLEVLAVLGVLEVLAVLDRKSTRLNSSHLVISYAVFCLKRKDLAY